MAIGKIFCKIGRNSLLGTIAGYLIGQKLVEVAEKFNTNAVYHGTRGKGNDIGSVLSFSILSLNPELEIIAPWRIWDIKSSEDAIDYAKKHRIEVAATKARPFSTDENISHEGRLLEDYKNESPDDIFMSL